MIFSIFLAITILHCLYLFIFIKIDLELRSKYLQSKEMMINEHNELILCFWSYRAEASYKGCN